MTASLNYFLEANLVLLAALALYFLFLQKETKFRMMRMFLLISIFAALALPLIDLKYDQAAAPLSIGRVIPSYWLPEVVVGAEGAKETEAVSFDFWNYVRVVYVIGFSVCLVAVLLQLIQLFRLYRGAKTYRRENLRIAESNENKPTFSFFNFIFIGNAHELSPQEQEQIILHESVHAREWHSLDILLINILRIFFWFNPFINSYKKAFIQVHEFEADARAVENTDVNRYSSLLAKVALRSEGYTLANHFNNSLTVKRIEMMRTIKTNIKSWKLASLTLVIPFVFFFIACQDQVGDDIMEIAQNSSHALIVPEQIQKTFEKMQKDNPEKKYVLLELNEKASEKLNGLQDQYGLPKSLTVFKTENGRIVKGGIMRGESENAVLLQKDILSQPKEHQTFAVVEYNDQTSKLSTASQEDRVFTVVEEAPEFPGGYDSMMVFIKKNLRYPTEARMQGIEGTVYVSFIVGDDGTVYDEKIVSGISPNADAEALRVMQLSPSWIPGKQNKEAVSVRFVLPIKFKLNN